MPCQGPWGGGYGYADYHRDYLEAERRLCEARWIILRLVEVGAAVPTRASTKLRALIDKHRTEQLKHRRGDKAHVLERIDATIHRVREDMAEIVRRGGEPGAALKAQVDELKGERARIKAITDEQLLADYWGTEKRLSSDLVDHE